MVDRLITLGKRGNLHARRQAISVLQDASLAQKLFGPLAERYASRNGGYTRVLKAGFRYGDAAPMAVIELVDRDKEAKGLDSGPSAENATVRPANPSHLKRVQCGTAKAIDGVGLFGGQAAPSRLQDRIGHVSGRYYNCDLPATVG